MRAVEDFAISLRAFDTILLIAQRSAQRPPQIAFSLFLAISDLNATLCICHKGI